MKARHSSIESKRRLKQPAQKQKLPGHETKMTPEPVTDDENYRGSGKLQDKIALITGGDSGIGSATAIAFAKEGAHVAILYLSEEKDANRTAADVNRYGRRCLKIRGDVGNEKFCRRAVQRVIQEFGQLDILVNNAAEQHVGEGIDDVSPAQLQKTFQTNFFGHVYLTQAALKYLKRGAAIINTTSIQAYRPKPRLMDYASTKAAQLNFTRSLARELAEKGIRVNAVAPGPVWTPLIPASFSPKQVKEFGRDTPLGRPAQPCEIAPSFVFLAAETDSSYFVGQVLHPNGGSGMFS